MKAPTTILLAILAITSNATPSTDTYVAVTNDWMQGNYSNVYEWAQLRLQANTNDLPAAYAMVEYDLAFSDFNAMSNSIQRMMRISETATLPAFTNLYQMTRPGWVYYLDTFLPSQDEATRLIEQQKSFSPGHRMTSSLFLKLFWDNDLW